MIQYSGVFFLNFKNVLEIFVHYNPAFYETQQELVILLIHQILSLLAD